ncbi:MAG TPA: MBL fold metallo-hydrolase, partial [Thermoanaerobaculia bacterium]|nr:MBL fold metallo-hydrolase [Thermoanaerobaculia bacterium]
MRFHNLDPAHEPQPLAKVLKWALIDRLSGRRKIAPPGPPAPFFAGPRRPWAEGGDRLLWIGHSSFLGRLAGRSFLIDPVLSSRIGFTFPRYGEPGLTAAELPEVSVVMVSHNHYDHL